MESALIVQLFVGHYVIEQLGRVLGAEIRLVAEPALWTGSDHHDMLCRVDDKLCLDRSTLIRTRN
ncbi:MAG TPA: hypothetical protein VM912_09635, partial [Terriglobales bacterium]|nr:hypothetical protein [Terriglobales bacterium]